MNLNRGAERKVGLQISEPLNLVAVHYQAHRHLNNNPTFDEAKII